MTGKKPKTSSTSTESGRYGILAAAAQANSKPHSQTITSQRYILPPKATDSSVKGNSSAPSLGPFPPTVPVSIKKPLRINHSDNELPPETTQLRVKDIGDKSERGLKRLFEEMNEGRRI